MTRDELVAALALVDIETLGRWYCQLNTWKVPDDFPAKVSGEIGVGRANHEFDAAFAGVSFLLGEKGASRAWWLYQLKRTEAEWLAWWNDGLRNGPSPRLISIEAGE